MDVFAFANDLETLTFLLASIEQSRKPRERDADVSTVVQNDDQLIVREFDPDYARIAM